MTANQRTGGSVITLGILHALKGQRNVEELLRAIPDAVGATALAHAA
jgi:hypothetical protein